MGKSKMRFSGYVWHHNPKALEIKCGKKILKYPQPFIKEIVQSFYDEPITVSGSGEFYGEDCLLQYKSLEEVFRKGEKGVLTLPGLSPFYAYFDKLSLKLKPTATLITYSFSFTQVKEQMVAETAPKTVTISKNCTLFDIANEYSVDIEKLVELNKNIMFINELKKGDVIRLC